MKLTVGSCFSGIGGLELGLEWTGGFETRWQIENDPYASAVLAKHWPHVARHGDIRNVGRSCLEPVDVICGGFPCQDVSLAGARAGLEGQRSTLWGEMFRLVCEVKPRWVVAENVPGLLSSDDGRFFGNILRDLAGAGYDAEWGVLSAAGVGAPHLRRRIFILAHANRVGRREERARESLVASQSNTADAQRHELRIKPRRSGGTSGSGSSLSGNNGEKESLADAERAERRPLPEGRNESNGNDARRKETSSGLGECGQDVSDAMFQGFQDGRQAGFQTSNEHYSISHAATERRGSAWWTTEPDVGGGPYGFPLWLYRHIGKGMSHAESKRSTEILRGVWNPDVAKAVCRALGGLGRMETAEVLFSFVREYEEDGRIPRELMAGPDFFEEELRGVRLMLSLGSPPQEQESGRQPPGEYSDALYSLSRFASPWEAGIDRVSKGIPKRVDRLRCLGNAVVPHVAQKIGEMILRIHHGT